jgi:hypothetical protein
MSRYENTHHCRQCKKGDELYSDAHGIFCSRCGPSVPVDRGMHLGDGVLTLGNLTYKARDMIVVIDDYGHGEDPETPRVHLKDNRPAAHKSPKPGRHATFTIPAGKRT